MGGDVMIDENETVKVGAGLALPEPTLYRFTEDERSVVLRRFQYYLDAVQMIAELHGLDRLGVPLSTDPQNRGFLLPPGMEIKRGETT